MSKVYSFRLSDNNPREAQAREVIEAWVGEGYSLRYVVAEALLSFKSEALGQGELATVVTQLQDIILSLDIKSRSKYSEALLLNSFLESVRNSARKGIKNH